MQEQVEGVRLIQSVMKELRKYAEDHEADTALNETLLAMLESSRQKHERDPYGGKYLAAFCRSAQQTIALEPEEPVLPLLEKIYSGWMQQVRTDIRKVSADLENTFAFFEEAGSNQEMVIFMTNLSVNEKCSRFIFSHPSEGYLRNSTVLALGERRSELLRQLDDMETADAAAAE